LHYSRHADDGQADLPESRIASSHRTVALLAASACFADNDGQQRQRSMAGRPALHGGEPGQVRKEAAIAILCKCRGSGSPPPLSRQFSFMLRCPPAAGAYVHHWYTARLRRSSALPETERDAK
jgi:hypothetical protein